MIIRCRGHTYCLFYIYYTFTLDYLVIDGGFQLLITAPEGVKGRDPNTNQNITLPSFTNLVFSWLRIKGCLEEDIVLPYKSASIIRLTYTTAFFELNITSHPQNPYGEGQSLGLNAPVIANNTIHNRIIGYITFHNYTSI
ncbi:hypothetical protein EB796_015437 [Bugula neritina]|uniref:Uncharacterized protein n=1 Tax=Bugula neritina TaxID=10212 RepID=A0A7J7JKU9_BUGNE|nr:hypothetical protein EB796_015437 [Bugula neritina]